MPCVPPHAAAHASAFPEGKLSMLILFCAALRLPAVCENGISELNEEMGLDLFFDLCASPSRGGQRLIGSHAALAGNRTSRVAGENPTIGPPMLACLSI